MATDDDQDQTCPEKLAEAVIRRRDSQGLTQVQVGSRGGPSTETMRLIEGARRTAYGSATLLRLDRALGWRDGTSARVLAGTATEDAPGRREHGPPPGPHDSASGERGAEPSGHAWAELGRRVKARRAALRLPQDLVDRGGPSEFTIRRIERGEAPAIRGKTKTQLEAALSAADGWVDRILDGTATAADLDPNTRSGRVVSDDDSPDNRPPRSVTLIEAATILLRLPERGTIPPTVQAAVQAVARAMPDLLNLQAAAGPVAEAEDGDHARDGAEE